MFSVVVAMVIDTPPNVGLVIGAILFGSWMTSCLGVFNEKQLLIKVNDDKGQ